ncbi:MAG: hypothetical protein FJ267_11600, partial [Planctomycetes bacterium]|nr:hypothetical protein [Planctomycetota bacterium]
MMSFSTSIEPLTSNDQLSRQEAIRSQCGHPCQEWIPFPRTALEESIVDRFEQMVDLYPDRVAVRMGKDCLTYYQLDRWSNQLAQTLLEMNGDLAEPVGLLLDQG